MRKKTIAALIIAAIMVISATAVFSHQARWDGQKQRGIRKQVWDKDNLVTLEGKITDAERPVITMDADGKEYILHAGPRRYWQEKEYTLEEGQTVKVTGVVAEADGKLNLYPSTIEADGKSIELTDEDGVPVWAGSKGGRGCGSCGNRPGHGRSGRGNMHGGRGRGYGHSHGWHGQGRGC